MPAAYWKSLPDGCTGNRAPLYKIEEICALLRTTEAAHVAGPIAATPAFTPAHRRLCRALDAACPTWSARTFQRAAAGRRAGLPLAGLEAGQRPRLCLPPALVCSADTPTFFLTGGARHPPPLCEKLTQKQLRNVQATLGKPGHRCPAPCGGTAQELPGRSLRL